MEIKAEVDSSDDGLSTGMFIYSTLFLKKSSHFLTLCNFL